MINELRRSSGISPSELILPTTLGPITLSSLNNVEGWRYDTFSLGYPGAEPALVNGGPVVTLVDYTDERGWILMFLAIFRSPYGTINFRADNWIFSLNPWYIATVGGLLGPVANPVTVYAAPYNPASPLGPVYGLLFTPVTAYPYSNKIQITLNLPAGSPVAATTIHNATVGKIWIVDQALFLKSIKRHIAEQMAGRRIDRYI